LVAELGRVVGALGRYLGDIALPDATGPHTPEIPSLMAATATRPAPLVVFRHAVLASDCWTAVNPADPVRVSRRRDARAGATGPQSRHLGADARASRDGGAEPDLAVRRLPMDGQLTGSWRGGVSARNRRRREMSKIKWLLAIAGSAALVSGVSAQAFAATTSASAQRHGGPTSHGAATILRFDTMTPVTGPYVGTANPVRGLAGGGLPWMIKSATGSLTRDGQLRVRVHGLVLADQSPVPPAMQGVNPIADFEAVVSCQSIGAGGTATVTNVITPQFPASKSGNSDIRARVHLPKPCIAPIVFVTSPGAPGAWFAATGG
jgi:hypothetical protein